MREIGGLGPWSGELVSTWREKQVTREADRTRSIGSESITMKAGIREKGEVGDVIDRNKRSKKNAGGPVEGPNPAIPLSIISITIEFGM